MAIYLFSQILKITQYSIKLIEKLSRRHLINSSDVLVIKGFTVCSQVKLYNKLYMFSGTTVQQTLNVHRYNHTINFLCSQVQPYNKLYMFSGTTVQ